MPPIDELARYQDFLKALQAATSEAERDWLTMAFSLETLPPGVQATVWAAAVPHWFDRRLLAALLETDLGLEEWKALLGLSFVELYPGRGHALHERSRTLLLDRLWRTDPDRFRALSRRAAAYSARQDIRDPNWRIEAIYHRLVAEPEAGTGDLINTGWEWQNPPLFAYDQMQALARAAREHLDGGRLAERGAAWTLFWEAHLDTIYSRTTEAKAKLLQIRLDPEEDPYTAANCLKALGDVHLSRSEIQAARHRVEQARAIYQAIEEPIGQADGLRLLGLIALQEGKRAEARRCLEQALAQFEPLQELERTAEFLEGLATALVQFNCSITN
jgi:tetratricopeptide (TPR) repeat protein